MIKAEKKELKTGFSNATWLALLYHNRHKKGKPP
jgi:hypothetical protein